MRSMADLLAFLQRMGKYVLQPPKPHTASASPVGPVAPLPSDH
jgi:hypothetical protein